MEAILHGVESAVAIDRTMQEQSNRFAMLARTLVIRTREHAQQAADLLRAALDKRAEIVAYFAPLKQQAYGLHKQLCERERMAIDAIAAPEKVIKEKVLAWQQEQARLQKEAETTRAEREQAQRVALIESAEARGDTEAADYLRRAAIVPLDEPVNGRSADLAGLSQRQTWVAEVESLELLVRAVADGRAPLTCLTADIKALGQIARATKGATPPPGVRFRAVTTLIPR